MAESLLNAVIISDRLCDLVVSVRSYRSRGPVGTPGVIFSEKLVCLQLCELNFARRIDEVLE
jgi:hypothetical protein